MPVRFRKLAEASRVGEPPRTQRFRAAVRQRRQRLDGAVAESAARLLPLVAIVAALQSPPIQESVFRTWRKKLRAHWDTAYAALQAAPCGPAGPGHHALAHALHTLAELLRDEARDISPEEWQRAAKELTLATLKNAPGLISAVQQAQRLA
ncbi:hypothetical protein HHL22_01225 [Hymenobacter sp. RP-2-7]|uniref:Uncharacterized protein n=1 Tax=Hymenobacter polaris TaxID=2682546 RepID=A0A7Y0AB28_9BACT|nr:hypothetical protein [Hymenobacter polaris]NML63815.1 hypothetical protein [Hymenobacter polaris]